MVVHGRACKLLTIYFKFMKRLNTGFFLTMFLIAMSCSSDSSEGKMDISMSNSAPNVSNLQADLLTISPFSYEFSVEASDPDQDPLSYEWDFGDGNTLSGSSKELHEFQENKEFTVNVTVSDGKNPDILKTVHVSTKIAMVTVNASVAHQSIEGFGGFGAEDNWWMGEPFYTQEFVDKLINDLGITILRDNIPQNFEPENDNDDPYVTDLTKFNITEDSPGSDSHLGQHLPYLRAMADAGLDKLIATVWTPPLWMKYNNHRGNGIEDPNDPNAYSAPDYTDNPDENTNQLRIDMYEEFAEYLVAYVNTVKAETGIDVYAISIQNEPVFSQFYASCVYNGAAYRDVLKVVGKRFEDEGLGTKLFGQEDVAIFDRIESFIDVISSDAEANGYLDIFAIHNYSNDGINPSDKGPQNWAESRTIADAYGFQLWMTETSGYDKDWNGAMRLGKSIYNALKYGNINAWVYWQMSQTGSGNGVLIDSGQLTKKYHVSKQFYKYIRPGAVQIECSVDDEGILSLAFQHVGNSSETIILINIESQNKVVKLENVSVDDYEIYQTTETQDFQKISAVGGIVLAPISIMTLYRSF